MLDLLILGRYVCSIIIFDQRLLFISNVCLLIYCYSAAGLIGMVMV